MGGIILTIAWLLHLLAASALLYQAGEKRLGVRLAMGWALAMGGPTLIGPWVDSLVAATVLSAFLAATLTAFLWRSGPGEASDDHRVQPRIHWGWTAAHAALFLLVVDACLEGYWWDEFSAHFGLTSVIARGILPPEFPIYPGELFRYHYGFDVLAGEIRAFTGVSSAWAIDTASIITFFILVIVSREAGRQLSGRWGAVLAPILIPLGSGTLQFLLFPDLGPLELRASWLPMHFGNGMPPPVISNFFQHPQGLGMPLGLGSLLLFTGTNNRRARWTLGTLLVGLTSLAHIVFFAVLGLVLGAYAVLRLLQKGATGWKETFVDLTTLASALVLAYLLGGFFNPTSFDVQNMIVWGEGHFKGTWLEVVAQHLVMFGLPLVALPFIAMRTLRRPEPLRVILLLAVVVGFLLPSLVRYERSWDIVKFYGIGGFFLNALFADWLASLFRSNGPRRAWVGLGVAVIMTQSCFTGLHFLVRMGPLDGRLGVPNMHFPPPSALGERAGWVLTQRMDDPRLRVFMTGWLDGVSSGLLAPGHNWRRLGGAWMLNRPRLDEEARIHGRIKRTMRLEDLDALRIKYALLAPHDLRNLNGEGRANLERYFVRTDEVVHGNARLYLYERR